MKPFSATQRSCIIAATIDPLIPFRRGFGHSKAGPFFDLRTVASLVKSGALRIFHPVRGKHRIQVSARAT
jgi:hypothetical protein